MTDQHDHPTAVTTDLPAFAMIPRWLIEDPDVTANAVRVYGALTRFVNLPDGAIPSRARLARAIGVSESTIKRSVRELEQAGALRTEQRVTERGDPTTNRYHLLIFPPGQVGEGSPADPPQGSQADPPQGSQVTRNRDNPSRETEVYRPTTSGASGSDDDGPTYPPEVSALTREFALMVKGNGHALPNRGTKAANGWLREMDRLRRLGPPGDTGDDPPPPDDEIREVMRWALTVSDFWPANIRSLPKFREQYTTLRAQARRPAPGRKPPPGQALAEGYSEAAAEFRRRRGGKG